MPQDTRLGSQKCLQLPRSSLRPFPLSDATFRAVVDAAPDAIRLEDATGTIVYANAHADELFGYGTDELSGERVERLVPERLRETRLTNQEVYTEQPHARGIGVGLHLSGRRRDGSLIPLEISLSPYHSDGRTFIVAIVRDVTQSRREEAVVRRSEARLRLVTENAADLIFRYRRAPTPAFEYVSAAARSITGRTPEDFYAHPELAIGMAHPDDREALSSAERQVFAVRVLREDGALRWLEYSVPSKPGEADEPVTEGVLRDVTERHEAEDERQRLLSAIETQLERERIAGDLHDDTIQSLYVLGFSLHSDLAAAPRPEAAAPIERAIAGLNAVISDMRAYMHELGGVHKAVAARDPFRARVEALLGGDGVEWGVDIPDDLELDEAVERHIYLLVKELVSNVRRHSHARHASISLRSTVEGFELVMRDDGIGYDRANVSQDSFGLRSIEHRASLLGATTDVDTSPGRGTSTIFAPVSST